MKVEFWYNSSGESQIADFVENMPPKAAKKTKDLLKRLEQQGIDFIVYSGVVRKLSGFDLYEFKVRFDKVFYRIIFIIKKAVCYMLNAFKKKSDKTPGHEIETALQRARAWALI